MKNKDNKLMAEFMGAKANKGGEYGMYEIIDGIEDTVEAKHFFFSDEMLFNQSWDWLIPVINKLKDFTFSDFDEHEPYIQGIEDAVWDNLIDVAYQHVVSLIALIPKSEQKQPSFTELLLKGLREIGELRENEMIALYTDEGMAMGVTEDIGKISTIIEEHYCCTDVKYIESEYHKHDYTYTLKVSVITEDLEKNTLKITISNLLKY